MAGGCREVASGCARLLEREKLMEIALLLVGFAASSKLQSHLWQRPATSSNCQYNLRQPIFQHNL